MNEQTTISKNGAHQLPDLDCGACGYRTCNEFSDRLTVHPEELKLCIHLKGNKKEITPNPLLSSPFMEMTNGNGKDHTISAGERMGWIDNLGRPFDFILDCFENEPGPRETILPYNPLLVKELGVKKGDIMIGRPMGMSCGCPITHCGIVTDTDPRNGVINWCVTGPLKPRNEGFIDIGYYVAQGYEGLIRDAKEEINLGKRY
jgi:uncharacterized Fe-S cluster-containing protein